MFTLNQSSVVYMSRGILLFTAVLLSLSSHAQDTLYYNTNWEKAPYKEYAAYYRVCTKQDSIYKTDDYLGNGRLYRTGYRTSLASENYIYRTGPYVYYDYRGNVTMKGTYDHGRRTGIWIYYYTGSTALRSEVVFNNNERSRSTYYDSLTQRIMSIAEEVTESETHTTRYTDTDTLLSIHKYSGDKREETDYYSNGGVKKRTVYEKNKKISMDCFNKQGGAIDCDTSTKGMYTYVEKMPKSAYSIPDYISQNVHYPDSAREHNIEGRVIVKFTVEEDGTIAGAKLAQGIGGGCDEEAIRVVSAMPPWRPGTQNGQPVSVYFTLPIVFKLK